MISSLRCAAGLSFGSQILAGVRPSWTSSTERASLFAEQTCSTLCHDDLQHTNLIFRAGHAGWELAGVLDWDKAWAGPGESDIARMSFWDDMTGPASGRSTRQRRHQQREAPSVHWSISCCGALSTRSARHVTVRVPLPCAVGSGWRSKPGVVAATISARCRRTMLASEDGWSAACGRGCAGHGRQSWCGAGDRLRTRGSRRNCLCHWPDDHRGIGAVSTARHGACTAQQVTALGGAGIAAPMDAGDDDQIAGVVDRISNEQGRLDVLVNSVWGGYERFTDGSEFNPGSVLEQPLSLWDSMHRIGVRAHYVTSALAAPLMINSGPGLIVSVSSFAGQVFVPPVPYGVAHAAIDRLARDMAEDLRPYKIASISLYPGLVLTESVIANIQYFENEANRETPLFVGRAVAALAADAGVLELTGRWLVAAEVAESYGLTDERGVRPASNRAQISAEHRLGTANRRFWHRMAAHCGLSISRFQGLRLVLTA